MTWLQILGCVIVLALYAGIMYDGWITFTRKHDLFSNARAATAIDLGTMCAMPDITSILKAEISRIARKEVRVEIESLKKSSVAYRASIAELRRLVGALEKELRRVAKGTARPAAAPDPAEEAAAGTKRRFSATRLAAHRAKHGLSAASYGHLVGVSGQTIYHWEQGRARPRAAQLESLAAVRDLGPHDIEERLAAR